MTVDIPEFGTLTLNKILLDLNGTITNGGILIEGVVERIKKLTDQYEVLLLSGDTNGNAATIAKKLGIELEVVKSSADKQQRCSDTTVAIGNGSIDRDMLKASALGIVVVEKEGASVVAINNADIVTSSINDALDALIYPNRLIATLRR